MMTTRTMKTSIPKRMRKMKINPKHISITILTLETVTYLLKTIKKFSSTIK